MDLILAFFQLMVDLEKDMNGLTNGIHNLI